MRRALPVLLALALAACGDRAPHPPPEAGPPEPAADTLPEPDPPTPFDAAEPLVDSTEPPEQVVEIEPRPTPPPPPRPPVPVPRPETSGSCDVRDSEGFCFAYTGDGWTPQTAEAHCDAAPASTFAGSACPLVGRIATCTFVRPDDLALEIVYTYYEPYDVALAELACPGEFERL